MPSNRVAWYRWRFSLFGTLGVCFFFHAGWESIIDNDESLRYRIGGAGVSLFIALLLLTAEWRNRSAHLPDIPSDPKSEDR